MKFRSNVFVWLLIACSIAIGQVAYASPVPLRPFDPGTFPVSGHIRWVAPTGSDLLGDGTSERPFATPAAAANLSAPGDTVVVRAGHYPIFGRVTASGNETARIEIRPETEVRPVFELGREAEASLTGSYIRLAGFEFQRTPDGADKPCLTMESGARALEIVGLSLNSCERGLVLGSLIAPVVNVSVTDVEATNVREVGVDCSACQSVHFTRLKLMNVGTDEKLGVGFNLGSGSADVSIEDSQINDVRGNGLVTSSTVAISNSEFRRISDHSLVLNGGGWLLNSDVRESSGGLIISGARETFLRGNLIEGIAKDETETTLQVTSSTVGELAGNLSLIGNRIFVSHGGLDLSVPLTFMSNTFMFATSSDSVELVGGRVASAEEFGGVQGEGIVNRGGNISVVAQPTADDLISPIFIGAPAKQDANTGGYFIFSGSRLKGSRSTVYVYASDGRRHVFANEKIYRTWFQDFSDVVTISDEAMTKIPLGRDVTYRPGARLVKLSGDAKVYAVTRGSKLRWIANEQVAQTLYGPRWASMVDDISETHFHEYDLERPIETATDYNPTLERFETGNPAELFVATE